MSIQIFSKSQILLYSKNSDQLPRYLQTAVNRYGNEGNDGIQTARSARVERTEVGDEVR